MLEVLKISIQIKIDKSLDELQIFTLCIPLKGSTEKFL